MAWNLESLKTKQTLFLYKLISPVFVTVTESQLIELRR